MSQAQALSASRGRPEKIVVPIDSELFLPKGHDGTLDAIVAPPEVVTAKVNSLPGVSVHPDYLHSSLFAERCKEAHAALEQVLGNVLVSNDMTLCGMASLISQLTIAPAKFLCDMFREPQYRLMPHPVRTMGVSHDTLVYHPDVVLWAVGRRVPLKGNRGVDLKARRARLLSVLLHEALHYSDGDLVLLLDYYQLLNMSPAIRQFVMEFQNMILDAIHDRALHDSLTGTSAASQLDLPMLGQHAIDMLDMVEETLVFLEVPRGAIDQYTLKIAHAGLSKGQAVNQAMLWFKQYLDRQPPAPAQGGEGAESGGEGAESGGMTGSGPALPAPGSDGGGGHVLPCSAPEGEPDLTPASGREAKALQQEVEVQTDNNKALAAAGLSPGEGGGVLGLTHQASRTQREIDWRQLLTDTLTSHASSGGTLPTFRRHRQQEALQRIYLPTRFTPQLEVAALLDVSGSMFCPGSGLGELIYTLTTVVTRAGCEELSIVPFDTACYPTVNVNQGNARNRSFDFGGGGGTSLDMPLRELAKRIDAKEISSLSGSSGALLIATDAYVRLPDPELIKRLGAGLVVWLTGEHHQEQLIRQVLAGNYQQQTGARALHVVVK